MTRELHGHKSSEKDPLRILVIDQPGSGNANHAYLITGMAGLMENASTDMTMSYLEGEEIPPRRNHRNTVPAGANTRSRDQRGNHRSADGNLHRPPQRVPGRTLRLR